jgi:hypothetical protein
MRIMAIDPGNKESAYVIWDGQKIHGAEKVPNESIIKLLPGVIVGMVVFEQVACYGMPVGEDVFETVFWTGRMVENCVYAWHDWDRIKRSDVKMHICRSTRAKDSNIITALVDRFDSERKFGKYGKGTKKNPGPFFGFSKDVWQALALAVTYHDKHGECEEYLKTVKMG